jgi:hypothetical protein
VTWYARASALMAVAMVLLGVAMTGITIAGGGGIGLLLGPLFALAGGLRLWMLWRG